MRPRYLEIEGLQSFKETQKIDFDKLGETGLFGIFGPTGSGKSTILDAITLALYGNVQRANRGTQGIINTDMSNVRVSFTFDLLKENTRKTYKVERVYKRKKGSDSFIEARLVRLFEIAGDGDIVMADKEREVTAKVIDLVGLDPDDFTRSVVLPQNKFQEFLLLDKAKKRDMMERIFYLEEYGRGLTEKVGKKLSDIRNKLSHIEGAMSSLGDASEKALIEAEGKMKTAWQDKENSDDELKMAEIEYNEAKEVWELVNELKDITDKEKEHLSGLEEINNKRKLYEKAVKADGLVDVISKYREAEKNLADTRHQLESIYKLLPDLETQMNKAQAEYDRILEKAEIEIPMLVELKAKFNNALEVKQEICAIETKLQMLRDSYRSHNEKIRAKDQEVIKKKQELEALEKSIMECRQDIEKLKVDVDDRKQVQAGIKLEEELNKARQDRDKHQREYNDLSSKICELEIKLEEASKQTQLLQAKLEELKSQQVKHESTKPGDRNELMADERNYHDIKLKWEALRSKKADIDAISARLDSIHAHIQQQGEKCKEAELHKTSLEALLNTGRERVEKFKTLYDKNTAYALAKNLSEGLPCPVCGSLHHPNPANAVEQQKMHEIEQQLKQAEEQLAETEKSYRLAENNCIKLHEQLKVLESQSVQTAKDLALKQDEYVRLVNTLPRHMQDLALEQLETVLDHVRETNEKKLKAIEQWETKLEEIKKSISKLEDALSGRKIEESVRRAELEINKDNLLQQEKALNECIHHFKHIFESYNIFIKKLGIQSISSELDRIEQNDRKIEKRQQQMEQLQKSSETIKKEIEQLIADKQAWESKAADVQTEGRSLREQQEEKIQKLKELTGDKDIEEGLKEIDMKIALLQKEKQRLTEYLKEIREQFNNISTQKSTLENQKTIYVTNLHDEMQRLHTALEQRGFASVDEVENCLLSGEQQKCLHEEIKQYEDIQKKLETQKDLLNKKLNGRRITEEQWQTISENYLLKKQQKEDSISRYENAKSIYNNIKKNFDQWVELNKEWQKYSKKKEMLDQIQKLLKGNSFIEFISEERLRYIAKEASELLGVLTRYRYTLELDTENGFVIRDNANGGVHRPVSSLSGGETFLTSLSLALALSSQIQLKGQSPLEFFFLDEGFGTLDTNLLDTVIDSLERLSTTKRVIGLISHVPELKSRITRRLIVEPPSSDGKGSQVRIEKA